MICSANFRWKFDFYFKINEEIDACLIAEFIESGSMLHWNIQILCIMVKSGGEQYRHTVNDRIYVKLIWWRYFITAILHWDIGFYYLISDIWRRRMPPSVLRQFRCNLIWFLYIIVLKLA
jgi:hypothetical protein